MKYAVSAIVIAVMIAGSSHAVAQSAPSTDVIMQRLDAMDKRNAKLESENAALRDRVRLLEVGKRSAATAASPTAPAASPTSAMAMVPKSSTSGVYKAPIAYPPSAYNWTGFYVGGHVGGGLASKHWTDLGTGTFFASQPGDDGSHKATGPLGGIQAGYNWQIGHLVLGVEGQYSFSNLTGDHQNTLPLGVQVGNIIGSGLTTNSFSTKVDGIATIAGRIGFASDPIDRTLFYVTGGAAFAKDTYAFQSNWSAIQCFAGPPSNCAVGFGNGTLSGSQNRIGWMAGAGIEHGLTENWSAKLEYNYLDFGTKTANLQGINCLTVLGPGCVPATGNFDVSQNMQLIKLGIHYRFSGGAHY